MRTIPLPWTTVFAPNDAGPHLGSTSYFIPATGWMRCADIVEIRAGFEVIASTSGTLNIQVGYQLATNENDPDAVYVADGGGWHTGVDVYYPTAWQTATDTDSYVLIRFGFLAKDTNDTLGMARACGRVDVKTCS